MGKSDSNTSYVISPLAEKDFNIAVSLLFQAYKEDRIFSVLLEAEKKASFEAQLRVAIKEELRSLIMQSGIVLGLYIDGHLSGVIGCQYCSNTHHSTRSFGWRLKLTLHIGVMHTQAILDKESKLSEAIQPYYPCHLLTFLAIEPALQSRGLSHVLMEGLNEFTHEPVESKGVICLLTDTSLEYLFKQYSYLKVSDFHFSGVQGHLFFRNHTDTLEKTL